MVDIKNNSELKADLKNLLDEYVDELANEISSGNADMVDTVEDGMDKIGEYIDETLPKEESQYHWIGDILASYCDENMSDEEFDKYVADNMEDVCSMLDDILGENYSLYENTISGALEELEEAMQSDGIKEEYLNDRYRESRYY